jgi:hypothetical protein
MLLLLSLQIWDVSPTLHQLSYISQRVMTMVHFCSRPCEAILQLAYGDTLSPVANSVANSEMNRQGCRRPNQQEQPETPVTTSTGSMDYWVV